MRYLAVLGRQPAISVAELESLFFNVTMVSEQLASFESTEAINIARLGGCLKLAVPIEGSVMKFLKNLPEGKITIGLSDYSLSATARRVGAEALKMKKILVRHGRSVRVIPNRTVILSSATSFHNGVGKKSGVVELIRHEQAWYRVVAVQNIDSYRRRDQERPARDAKIGMLPPKLAQILINLCGGLEPGARILDPFCGTGVVLQEAQLMGLSGYGTDLNERMVEYAQRNLKWLEDMVNRGKLPVPTDGLQAAMAEVGDATNHEWRGKIDAVACETYLGPPMSMAPSELKLKEVQHECGGIILKFLANLGNQIASGTPVTLATPAWLRQDGSYQRLKILDEIEKLGYNEVKYNNASAGDLLYHREGQIVARAIIVLRKK